MKGMEKKGKGRDGKMRGMERKGPWEGEREGVGDQRRMGVGREGEGIEQTRNADGKRREGGREKGSAGCQISAE